MVMCCEDLLIDAWLPICSLVTCACVGQIIQEISFQSQYLHFPYLACWIWWDCLRLTVFQWCSNPSRSAPFLARMVSARTEVVFMQCGSWLGASTCCWPLFKY
eukprot:5625084-Amphidinium_carterae.1